MRDSLSAPKLSIVTPARNAGGTILTTINSVRSQKISDWEMLVINDGSFDDTPDIVERLMAHDSRIRLLHGGGNGVSAARNLGLANATGEYIGFLDADDIYFPGSLDSRVAALDQNRDWQVTFCPTEVTDEAFRPLWALGHRHEVLSFKDMNGSKTHINALLGRAKVMKGQQFQVGLTNGEDWLYMARILRTGVDFHRVLGGRVAYRLHPDSTVGKDFLAHENNLQQVVQLIYAQDPGCVGPLPEYVNGITKPPIEQTILQRRCGLLAFLLLSKRLEDIEKVAADPNGVDFWPKMPKSLILGSIRFAAARFFACHVSLSTNRLLENRDSLLATIEASGLDATVPWFTGVLLEQLGDGSISVEVAANGNGIHNAAALKPPVREPE